MGPPEGHLRIQIRIGIRDDPVRPPGRSLLIQIRIGIHKDLHGAPRGVLTNSNLDLNSYGPPWGPQGAPRGRPAVPGAFLNAFPGPRGRPDLKNTYLKTPARLPSGIQANGFSGTLFCTIMLPGQTPFVTVHAADWSCNVECLRKGSGRCGHSDIAI